MARLIEQAGGHQQPQAGLMAHERDALFTMLAQLAQHGGRRLSGGKLRAMQSLGPASKLAEDAGGLPGTQKRTGENALGRGDELLQAGCGPASTTDAGRR